MPHPTPFFLLPSLKNVLWDPVVFQGPAHKSSPLGSRLLLPLLPWVLMEGLNSEVSQNIVQNPHALMRLL